MILLVWVALGASLVLVLAAAVFAGVRALDAWRAFRRLRRRVADGLGDVTSRVARIEPRLNDSGAGAARLERAQTELQESIAAARVLSGAFGEVRTALSRVTGLIPSK